MMHNVHSTSSQTMNLIFVPLFGSKMFVIDYYDRYFHFSERLSIYHIREGRQMGRDTRMKTIDVMRDHQIGEKRESQMMMTIIITMNDEVASPLMMCEDIGEEALHSKSTLWNVLKALDLAYKD